MTSLPLLLVCLMLGCRSEPRADPPTQITATRSAEQPDRIVGYVNGKPIYHAELYRVMAPRLGGEAMAEVTLDRLLEQRLAERQTTLDDAAIEAEKQILMTSLSSNPDQAMQLLKQMQVDRGLNEARFASLLRRNAALRALIAKDATVAPAAIDLAYQLAFGRRYRVRLLVVNDLHTAKTARAKALAGQSFAEVVIEYSTDSSRSQGGLLSPISPADTSYPKAIRDALPTLSTDRSEDRISPILAIDSGFALLWLDEEIPAKEVALETVEAELRRGVELQVQRVRMQQLARSLLERANVVVLDPLLKPGWETQQEAIRRGAE